MDQGKKGPKYFWVPAIAPLISVVLSTFFVYITRADKHGVAIVSIYNPSLILNIAEIVVFNFCEAI